MVDYLQGTWVCYNSNHKITAKFFVYNEKVTVYEYELEIERTDEKLIIDYVLDDIIEYDNVEFVFSKGYFLLSDSNYDKYSLSSDGTIVQDATDKIFTKR